MLQIHETTTTSRKYTPEEIKLIDTLVKEDSTLKTTKKINALLNLIQNKPTNNSQN